VLGVCLLAATAVSVSSMESASAARRHGHRRPPCLGYRCVTVAADAVVQVFQRRVKHPDREVLEGPETFARWLPSGRVTALGDYSGGLAGLPGTSLGPLRLDGRFVAYVLRPEGPKYPGSGHSEELKRLNVASGWRLSIGCRGPAACDFPDIDPGVNDIGILATGAMGWIVSSFYEQPALQPEVHEVWELPAHATQPIRVAASAAVEATSLAAIPGHLYWTEGGQPREVEVK
jgi:hypothetical protein